MSQDYYRILGVSRQATIDQIKQAYRSKAKRLHPDVNKASDAHDRFIELNEAYEYLLLLKTGKIYNRGAKRYKRTRKKQNTQENWEQTEREKARERARENSRIRYAEYVKSHVYQTSLAQATVIEHVSLFVSLIFLLSPLWGFIALGVNGLVGGIMLAIVSAPAWLDLFRKKTDWKGFKKAVLILSDEREFYWVLLSILNLILLFTFSINTVMSTFTLLSLLIGSIALGYVIGKVIDASDIKLEATVLGYCVFPLMINLFFSFNGVFSHSPYEETYTYTLHQEYRPGRHGRKGRMESTSYLILDRGKYKGYHWMCTFFDIDLVKRNNKVTYHMEQGAFGVACDKRSRPFSLT